MTKLLRFTEVLAGSARVAGAPAVVTLGFEDRRRSRLRIRIDDGREAALMLPRGTILHDVLPFDAKADRMRFESETHPKIPPCALIIASAATWNSWK